MTFDGPKAFPGEGDTGLPREGATKQKPTVHLVGIGGTGMLPLALLLHESGAAVSGSDDNLPEARLRVLQDRGIAVPVALDVARTDRVVASPAVAESHPERRLARRAAIPVAARAHALAGLVAGRETICVAGSHGKSTTAAMLVHILTAADETFGYMVGADGLSGEWPPARLGPRAAPFVMEACEAHGALAAWRPHHVLLTNIGDDHAVHYGGAEGLRAAFADFAARASGTLVVCGDDPRALSVARAAGRPVLTYGFGAGNRLRADDTAVSLDGVPLGELTLRVPGRHNRLNALGALGMALEMGVVFPRAIMALAHFEGMARRLQPLTAPKGIAIVDDFAHHPAEIAATLAALRETASGRLIAILEPQLHSRVGAMADAFAEALKAADRTLLLPVAGLGESGDGDALLRRACEQAGLDFEMAGNRIEMLAILQSGLCKGDTLVVMAGRTGEGLAPFLSQALRPPRQAAAALSIVHGEEVPAGESLFAAFLDHARRRAQAPAVEMGHRRLSYGRLAARAADLAGALTKAGVRPQDCVAVCLGRSVDRVTAFLACLKIGAVFLPLDPALPSDRHAFTLQDAGARTVVVNAASPALAGSGLTFVNAGDIDDREPVPDDVASRGEGDGPAYIIYTSGTSGRPKGVEVGCAAIANYAATAARHFGVGFYSRVSQASSFGFDVSVGDTAMALFAGACLVYPTDMHALPGAPMGRFIAHSQITHLSLTPSGLSVIPAGDYPCLTHVVVAGEACHPALVARWGRGRTFINAYGPTEATVEATWAVCRPGEAVTIGAPFDNIGACILDGDLQPVPVGEEGELCLFGAGLALGYRNLAELTVERFPTIVLPDLGPRRIYRTGDRAVLGADGRINYRGRLDDQVKFHGYRIEPAEIEAALCRFPDILDAVVSVHSGAGGDRLVAHVTLHPLASSLDIRGLRRDLEAWLPAYMVPSIILPVHEIPRTPNGKRDRASLSLPPEPDGPSAVKSAGTPTEIAVMALVGERLGRDFPGGIRDSLTRHGLDSLAMADLLFAIEDRFGIVLDGAIAEGMDTVEALALMVDARADRAQNRGDGTPAGKLVAALMPHLAAWPGEPAGVSGLMRRIEAGDGGPPLFWCFQSRDEFSALHTLVRDRAALYGVRSGHLAFEYTSETVDALAGLYADDIEAVAPGGPVFLGGNCQGGMVMRAVGEVLLMRGRDVALTVLMEQGRFPRYGGRVLLLFGAKSYLNPYGRMEGPDGVFRLAYPAGHSVAIIPGGHGQYFSEANVGALAEIIAGRMEMVE